MAGLIVFHLRHDGARFMVTGRESFKVAREVRFHLAFCLDHEPQTEPVAQPARNQPEAECPGVPQRVEQ